MTKKIDLHMHTTASDGTLTPEELILELKNRNIDTFSITDHDAVSSISETFALAKNNQLHFIPGIEISTTYFEREIHLLVYGINPSCPLLNEIMQHNNAVRNRQSTDIIELVSKESPLISIEDYLSYERNPKNGGWKSENYLRDRGVTKSLNAFFDYAKKVPTMVFPSPLDLIPKLKKKGYLIILAHPPAYFNGQLLEKSFLGPLLEVGLDGIECYSPYYNSPTEKEYYINFCKDNNLLMTVGSDYHGAFIPSRQLGEPPSSDSEVVFPFELF